MVFSLEVLITGTVRAHESQIPVQWVPIIIFAVVLGLGVKLGGFLLHPWVPSSQAGSPTPVAIMLVGIATYGFLRIWLDLLGGNYAQYSLYVNIWGLATMIYGGAMALMQDDIRKVLVYSTMSNMGYILFGIGSASVLGVTGVTLLYVTSGLGKAILFMMAGSISLQTGTTSMSKLRRPRLEDAVHRGCGNDWCANTFWYSSYKRIYV